MVALVDVENDRLHNYGTQVKELDCTVALSSSDAARLVQQRLLGAWARSLTMREKDSVMHMDRPLAYRREWVVGSCTSTYLSHTSTVKVLGAFNRQCRT